MAKSNLQFYFEKLPKPLRNKFLVTIGLFMIWMAFFDRHSLLTQFSLQSTLQELREKKVSMQAEIQQDSKKQLELSTDDKSLEKFAREEHLMKKDDEDIFIITTEEK